MPGHPEDGGADPELRSELKVRAALQEVPVTTQEEADAFRFLGSPTVHIDGRDIDPAVRDSMAYGFL